MDANPIHRSSSAAVLSWQELCDVVWQALREPCGDLHRQLTGGGCPGRSAPYGRRDPSGRTIPESCRSTGCLDLLHDTAVAVRERLDRQVERHGEQSLDEPQRYAYRVATAALRDARREQRTKLGFAAKPGRSDGRPARVIAALVAAAGDDTTGAAWLETLFRMIRDFAHKPDRTSAWWPLDGWAAEKSRIDGVVRDPDNETRREIRDDIALVLQTARAVVGPTWVHLNVYHPLMASMRPTELDVTVAHRGTAVEDEVLHGWFRSEYARRRRDGQTAVVALVEAVRLVTGREVPELDLGLRALLRELDSDLDLAG